MRHLLSIALLLALVTMSAAQDWGARRPIKPATSHPQNVPSAERQGGDTVLDPFEITLPVVDLTGTTAGYTNDYDEMCPYTGNAPDVVYAVTPEYDASWDLDLCGSSYDTKIYIYDENLALVACNDDFYFDDDCGVYVSRIEQVALAAGTTYYIVIDGYGTEFGDYVLNIDEVVPCVIDCPAGGAIENEPPLVDGYEDAYNGGCNSPQFGSPFGSIYSSYFCGVSGWYYYAGVHYRDTDWFELEIPATGYLEIVGDAEQPTIMFELGPQDCDNVGVLNEVAIGPCQEGYIAMSGTPGSTVWFWVGPSEWEDPDEYDYFLWLWLIIDETESQSWTDVKALFRRAMPYRPSSTALAIIPAIAGFSLSRRDE
jgi:hypothetical protein